MKTLLAKKTGYKATDENMRCQGFQFELGKWFEHNGDVVLCEAGFHFCEYPSGPWAYYNNGRLFSVEAEQVLVSTGPGADLKHVAKRIRLVEEIKVTGDLNTGYLNTGDLNTGDQNTGDLNTGNRNTGNRNTGHQNTGHRNTGNQNTGHQNTGHRNTGNQNTGHQNTGDRNTGNRNTGNQNTGDRNTGDGNCGNGHTGSLCWGESPLYLFNKKANKKDGVVDWSLVRQLSIALAINDPIDPTPFLVLPNATPAAIKTLHDAHKEARGELNMDTKGGLNV